MCQSSLDWLVWRQASPHKNASYVPNLLHNVSRCAAAYSAMIPHMNFDPATLMGIVLPATRVQFLGGLSAIRPSGSSDLPPRLLGGRFQTTVLKTRSAQITLNHRHRLLR